MRGKRVAAVDVERGVHELDAQIKHVEAELNRRREDRELVATLLVAGEKAGSKLAKAEELGIPVHDEAWLRERAAEL